MVPDSKIHMANMGPIWGRQDPGGPHVGPMNFAIWGVSTMCLQGITWTNTDWYFTNQRNLHQNTMIFIQQNAFIKMKPEASYFQNENKHQW